MLSISYLAATEAVLVASWGKLLCVYISHENTFGVKMVRASKVESYLEVNTCKDWRQQDLISEYAQGALAYWTHKYYIGYIIASYCFQSLIGIANLLSAISCYKFHILKD